MLKKLSIRNFKRFKDVEIDLDSTVVFAGPNNSGKTTALQALSLWETGVKRWIEKREGKSASTRSGVVVNRRDLVFIPQTAAKLLWPGGRVRTASKNRKNGEDSNVRIDIIVNGKSNGKDWVCGMEFDYANEEVLYCRPLRLPNGDRMSVPKEAAGVKVAYLPPMSGLASIERMVPAGAVSVLAGEGRTADILRNICKVVCESYPHAWNSIVERIMELFEARLHDPEFIPERGEIHMSYTEGASSSSLGQGARLELSSSGRGMLQTLLLLSYIHLNQDSVLLLDEPDAHLEILRQRQIYREINAAANETGSQIIAASHSEVFLNEAVRKDSVVAFVGRPHLIPKGDRDSQLRKALAEIGFEQYLQAEQIGWVLYLDGSTELSTLQAFAKRLGNQEAIEALRMPFVRHIADQPKHAENHFFELQEALPGLRGIAFFDQREDPLPQDPQLKMLQWRRKEIECYFCTPKTLENFAKGESTAESKGLSFQHAEKERRKKAMAESIDSIMGALKVLHLGNPWDPNFEASGNFLLPLFNNYYKKLGIPNQTPKKNLHALVDYIPDDDIDPEIAEKLDAIVAVAQKAKVPEEYLEEHLRWQDTPGSCVEEFARKLE